LVAWTVAEAKYYAYEIAWNIHSGLITAAGDIEAAYLVTKE